MDGGSGHEWQDGGGGPAVAGNATSTPWHLNRDGGWTRWAMEVMADIVMACIVIT